MVLIVTCLSSVGMTRFKGANLKHANITNMLGAGVAIYLWWCWCLLWSSDMFMRRKRTVNAAVER